MIVIHEYIYLSLMKIINQNYEDDYRNEEDLFHLIQRIKSSCMTKCQETKIRHNMIDIDFN